MSSRQQEKERRRQERLEAEQAATTGASRKRKLQIAGGLVLAIAVIAVIAVIALAGGKDSGGGGNAASLAADARTAGCRFNSYRSEGRDHTTGKVTYKTNPPTSGSHNPVPAQDGIYAPGNEPAAGNWVHSLEHGRILLQYKPGSPQADIAKLRSLADEKINGSAGYHVLMFQNNTKMTAQYAAVAWTKSLTCDKLTSQSEDVIREFRKQFTDKGPEFIP
jgi:hypothetical protein